MATKSERSAPITGKQKELLVEFMEGHENLQSGLFTATFTKKMGRELWKEVTDLINSVPGGARKDWEQVRRCWQDMKKVVKTKMSETRRYARGTGGGEPVSPNLSTMEEKVLGTMPVVSVKGIETVDESWINSEYSAVTEPIILLTDPLALPSDCDVWPGPQTAPLQTIKETAGPSGRDVWPGSQTAPLQAIKETAGPSGRNALETPIVGQKRKLAPTSSRRQTPTKSRRLEMSMGTSSEMVAIARQQMENQQEYQRAKLELLQKKTLVYEKISDSLSDLKDLLGNLINNK